MHITLRITVIFNSTISYVCYPINIVIVLLQLAVNPLDLSSQKTKASVGRSGSIGGRRPPSRPRSIGKIDTERPAAAVAVPSICHATSNLKEKLDITDRQCGDGSVSQQYEHENNSNIDKDEKEYENIISQNGVDSQTPSPVEYEKLISEVKEPEEPNKQDSETGRRLSTALRGNNVDLDALDQILKSISGDTIKNFTPETDNVEDTSKKIKAKRHSFITVESLKEVRGRLRRLSSPIDDLYSSKRKDEDPDDGIASEDNTMIKNENYTSSNLGVSRVKSYVYGMEAMLGSRKTVVGTGSLESRTSGKLGTSINRSEDWYNRRKSYGFEQVHNQQLDQTNSISLHAKSKIESSTDSGICRSTEMVLTPTIKTQIFNKYNGDITKSETENGHKLKNTNSTIINLGPDINKNQINYHNIRKSESFSQKDDYNELFNVWNKRALNNSSTTDKTNNSEQLTITIPIVSEDKPINNNNKKLYHRQLSENSSVSIEQIDSEIKRHSIAVDESKYVNKNIENKYPFAQLRRTSLVIGDALENFNINDNVEEENINRKPKRVEFCKTEVHFAAESGRVNIVETDEKPPPTNNFRRRRRNSGITNNQTSEDMNKNGLPLIHFGDTSYEKQLFSIPDHDNIQINEIPDSYQRDSPVDNIICNSTVTVSSVPITNDIIPKDIIENENYPRGILKNKMMKPKPYLLGDHDDIPTKDTQSDQENGKIWGVKLRPVNREDSPMWKSTVTVQNTSYNIPITSENNSIENKYPKENVIDIKNGYDSSDFPKNLTNLNSLSKSLNLSESAFKPPVEIKRSSWSVADRIKQVENLRWTENKGYSTKVNFGSGEATVVENDHERQSLWSDEVQNIGKCFTFFLHV